MVKFVIVLTAVLLAISTEASKLEMPSFSFTGESAAFNCNIDHGDLPVKSITWTKDDKQFYKYTSGVSNPVISEVHGVSVNAELSTLGDITIDNLTLDSAGLYTCKFEIDHPSLNVGELSGTLKVVGDLTRSMKLH